jgi:hypothetical protein
MFPFVDLSDADLFRLDLGRGVETDPTCAHSIKYCKTSQHEYFLNYLAVAQHFGLMRPSARSEKAPFTWASFDTEMQGISQILVGLLNSLVRKSSPCKADCREEVPHLRIGARRRDYSGDGGVFATEGSKEGPFRVARPLYGTGARRWADRSGSRGRNLVTAFGSISAGGLGATCAVVARPESTWNLGTPSWPGQLRRL